MLGRGMRRVRGERAGGCAMIVRGTEPEVCGKRTGARGYAWRDLMKCRARRQRGRGQSGHGQDCVRGRAWLRESE